jgi:hypothetical protein
VIVAGSNFRASESEKGCGCLGWNSIVYVLMVCVMSKIQQLVVGCCGHRMGNRGLGKAEVIQGVCKC